MKTLYEIQGSYNISNINVEFVTRNDKASRNN